MYMRTALILSLTLLYSVVTVSQQESALTQGQRVVLDNPEVISLQLIPLTRRGKGLEKLAGSFKPRTKLVFALSAVNNSLIPLDVRSWGDTYSQNRPRLFRDGQEVPYREEIMDLLKYKDKEGGEIYHMFVIHLGPNERKVVENIYLSDWYEPLESGHYDLSVRHRFVQGGKLVDSSSIVFEVGVAK